MYINKKGSGVRADLIFMAGDPQLLPSSLHPDRLWNLLLLISLI